MSNTIPLVPMNTSDIKIILNYIQKDRNILNDYENSVREVCTHVDETGSMSTHMARGVPFPLEKIGRAITLECDTCLRPVLTTLSANYFEPSESFEEYYAKLRRDKKILTEEEIDKLSRER